MNQDDHDRIAAYHKIVPPYPCIGDFLLTPSGFTRVRETLESFIDSHPREYSCWLVLGEDAGLYPIYFHKYVKREDAPRQWQELVHARRKAVTVWRIDFKEYNNL